MPTASDTHSFTLGWGMLSIDKQNLEKGPLKIRVPLYEGSPRVLFTMDNITTGIIIIYNYYYNYNIYLNLY